MGIFSYIKIGVLIAALAAGAGAAWWVQGVRLEREKAKTAFQEQVILQQQQTLEWYQKAAEIDIDTAKERGDFHEAIKSGDPQRVVDYFKRMRELSSGSGEGED